MEPKYIKSERGDYYVLNPRWFDRFKVKILNIYSQSKIKEKTDER